MKLVKLTIALVLSLFSFSSIAQEKEKIQLLLLGTYHMDNPGQDVYNLEADDVLNEKRQQEIQRFVDKIAAFQPDKLLLEYRTEHDSLFNARYQAYLKGAALSRNEIEQLGFRLAKQLGHTQLYGADAHASFSMAPLMQWAEENEQQELVAEMNSSFTQYVQERQNKLKELPIDAYLTDLNRPEVLNENLRFYHDFMLRFADQESTPGPDLVSDWYKRNARIMANILQTAKPGDKIMLIFGSGHIPAIQQFAHISDRVELIDLQTYLHAN